MLELILPSRLDGDVGNKLQGKRGQAPCPRENENSRGFMKPFTCFLFFGKSLKNINHSFVGIFGR
jgi:hypothetical protein